MALTPERIRAFRPRGRGASLDAGFSLVELLVVSGIVVIVTGIMLVSNNRFGGRILLENLAYDVALSVRQAQVYGISVRKFETGDFDVSYGISFDTTNPTVYRLFGDANNSGLWDEEEDVDPSPYTIGQGFFVSKLCAPAGSDIETCTEVSRLDVIFQRPEPDAYISANGESGVLNPSDLQENGRVVLESPRGDRTSVVVEVTGQISVEK